jgi:hypothetical protein
MRRLSTFSRPELLTFADLQDLIKPYIINGKVSISHKIRVTSVTSSESNSAFHSSQLSFSLKRASCDSVTALLTTAFVVAKTSGYMPMSILFLVREILPVL